MSRSSRVGAATCSPESLPPFVVDALRAPDLEREAELRLIDAYQAGNRRAGELVTRATIKHAVALARRMARGRIPTEDLLAEAFRGISIALTRFDRERGTRFVTYAAYWMRSLMLWYIVKNWRMVGGGSGMLRTKVFFKLRRDYTRALTLTGDEPSAVELLASEYGASETEIRHRLAQTGAVDLSLDCEVDSENGVTWLDRLVDAAPDPEAELLRKQQSLEARERLGPALALLDRREARIVRGNLLVQEGDEQSLGTLACEFGISRQRVHQLLTRALQKIHTHLDEHPVRGPIWRRQETRTMSVMEMVRELQKRIPERLKEIETELQRLQSERTELLRLQRTLGGKTARDPARAAPRLRGQEGIPEKVREALRAGCQTREQLALHVLGESSPGARSTVDHHVRRLILAGEAYRAGRGRYGLCHQSRPAAGSKQSAGTVQDTAGASG